MKARFRTGMILLLSVLLVSIIACGKKEPEVKPLRPVRYQRISAKPMVRVLSYSGVAQAGQESRLSFRVSGTVEKVYVKLGDMVKSGQEIAILESRDYALRVKSAQASLNAAEAQARRAKADYDRVRLLYENNNASPNDLDGARTAFESAEAQVDAASNQLELARRQLSYTHLIAPVDGGIAAVNVEASENVSPGQPVVVLTSGSNVEVKVTIPEAMITQIKDGDEVEVLFSALDNKERLGKVTEVGVATTGMATTFPVTVVLDDGGKDIRPGMAAEVRFRFSNSDKTDKRQIVVPLQAVTEDQKGEFVYTVKPTEEKGVGIVERKNIVKGNITREGLEINGGLVEGDLLVISGVSRIHDGLRVKLLDEMEIGR